MFLLAVVDFVNSSTPGKEFTATELQSAPKQGFF